MASKLNMVFTRGNTTKTISLSNPREDLTAGEVQGVMQKILDRQLFTFDDEQGALDGIKRAYIRDSVIRELPEA